MSDNTPESDFGGFTTGGDLSDEPTARRQDAPLQTIYGVGETTADQLDEAGYLTVYDVAAADPSAIAEAVDGVGEATAEDYVSSARSMVEYWPGDGE